MFNLKDIEYQDYLTRRDLDLLFNKVIKNGTTPDDIIAYDNIIKAIDKAHAYDLERYKKSAGGRKSASLLTPEERIARARKAGKARKKEQSLEKIKGEF